MAEEQAQDTLVGPLGAYGVELIPLDREPHRAYPACCARELLDDDGRHKAAPKYPWCDRSARFAWGDQFVCALHAEKLVKDRAVPGITPNGLWGSCKVHIDCNHPIDDAEWATRYCPVPDRPRAGGSGD